MIRSARVYIDTSVIGGCCDPEFEKWSLRLMKDFELGIFIPVISELTEAEIIRAPAEVIEVLAHLKDLGTQVIEIPSAAFELRDVYLRRSILSKKHENDALHIATATVENIDILVSWNFKHVLHYDKVRRFNSVNVEMGYKPIEIHSPREVASYDSEND